MIPPRKYIFLNAQDTSLVLHAFIYKHARASSSRSEHSRQTYVEEDLVGMLFHTPRETRGEKCIFQGMATARDRGTVESSGDGKTVSGREAAGVEWCS